MKPEAEQHQEHTEQQGEGRAMSKWAGATTLEGSSVLTKRGWKKTV